MGRRGKRQRLTFTVEVPQAGLYRISVRYAQMDGHSGQIERGLLINGEMQFAECESFLFPKRFTDTRFPFDQNEYGNDVMPSQTGLFDISEIDLWDRYAFYEDPLLFSFHQGINTLTLTGVKGGLSLAGITLRAPAETPDYAQYSADRQVSAASSTITIEAETVSQRSSRSINLVTVSEPGVTPIEAGYKRLNTLGGDNWRNAGDFAQWSFTVEEAGWYRLAVNYKQNYNTAMTSFRRVEIDAAVPFARFPALRFPSGPAGSKK